MGKADIPARNLLTIGDFRSFHLFNILNACSSPFPSTGASPQPQDGVQYAEQLFYTWAITIFYGGGHGGHGDQSGHSGGAGTEYSGSSRAKARGADQRGDQPQARDTEELRELHPED